MTNEAIPTLFDSTVVTYRLNDDLTLTTIDTKPSPGAACWNLFTNNNKFLYTSNPGGNGPQGTEDAFRVAPDGTMTPIAQYTTKYQAIDNALSHNSQFLNVLSDQILPPAPPVSAINEYAIDQSTGALTRLARWTFPGTTHPGSLPGDGRGFCSGGSQSGAPAISPGQVPPTASSRHDGSHRIQLRPPAQAAELRAAGTAIAT